MSRMTLRALAVVAIALTLAWGHSGGPCLVRGEEPPPKASGSFDERVAPLLARHCLECHGPASKKGGLDLSRKGAAFAGGKSGNAIVPERPGESLLWEHVESGAMPPKSRPPLSAADKQVVREWIAGGAAWPDATADISRFAPDRNAGHAWVRRLTVPEYIETVRDTVGVNVEREARELLPRDLRADGFSNTAYNLTVDLAHVEGYAKLSELVARRVDAAAFAARFTKSRDLGDDNLRQLIAGMGKRLLRGPLDDREVTAFLRVAHAVKKEGGDFSEVTRYLIEAMLQSPRFVYRIENQQTDYALASRLSYILWGAPPDEELMRAADAGELSDPGAVGAQVRRMLKDPRTVAQSRRFVSEWLDLDRLDAMRPDPKLFPKWDPQLASDMRDETLAFFEEVAWNQNRPLPELLNAQVTFLTPRLADHYGLKQTAAATSGGGTPGNLVGRATRDLQALYTFEQGSGDTVRDVSGAGEPLDLRIEKPSAVRWGGGQLTVTGPTLIATDGPPHRLIDAVKKSKEVTLEAWVTPANREQSGPARILTLSSGPSERNFTLGQDAGRYVVRFRTTKTDANGQPTVDGPTNILYTRPTHVAYTRDAAGKARLYIDGEEKANRDVGGDLSNWDEGFRLALANEATGDRPWKGTFHLVAIYSRALTPDEVQGNARGLARYDLSSVPGRGGLLTHGSVLTVGGDNASTVTRGLFVLRELLYSGVDDPPPGVDTTPVPARPGLSNRAVAMQRINNNACAECHKKFETIAFGLEKFDGVGGYAEADRFGNTLRDDGEILFPGASRPTKFRSSAELMDLLANSDRVSMALTRKVTQFALGRPLTVADGPAVEAIHADARKNGGTYAAIITAVATSDLVQKVPAATPSGK
jgi:mono/diheme cytochrome c family protein